MGKKAPVPDGFEALYEVDGDPDRIMRTLASPRCRHLLALLLANDGTVSLEDAATDVAAWEFGSDPDEISRETVDHMLTSLYHAQAPKMADAELAEFDAAERTLTISDVGSQLDGLSFLPSIE